MDKWYRHIRLCLCRQCGPGGLGSNSRPRGLGLNSRPPPPPTPALTPTPRNLKVCVCVCVCERERERERGGGEREREVADITPARSDQYVDVLLYVHRNRRFVRDGEPRTSTSTFTQLLSSVISILTLLCKYNRNSVNRAEGVGLGAGYL